jgi:hypothetical protein
MGVPLQNSAMATTGAGRHCTNTVHMFFYTAILPQAAGLELLTVSRTVTCAVDGVAGTVYAFRGRTLTLLEP